MEKDTEEPVSHACREERGGRGVNNLQHLHQKNNSERTES